MTQVIAGCMLALGLMVGSLAGSVAEGREGGVMEAAERSAIEAVFESYQQAWAANDAAQLEAHWDTTDATPVYLAEEIDQPMTDWPAVRAYWQHNEGFHEKVRLQFSDYTFKPLGEDAVMVVMQMRWDIRFRNFTSEAMGGDNRVVTTLRRVDGQWRLTSWSEAPLAPIVYMRRLYERDVAKDF